MQAEIGGLDEVDPHATDVGSGRSFDAEDIVVPKCARRVSEIGQRAAGDRPATGGIGDIELACYRAGDRRQFGTAGGGRRQQERSEAPVHGAFELVSCAVDGSGINGVEQPLACGRFDHFYAVGMDEAVGPGHRNVADLHPDAGESDLLAGDWRGAGEGSLQRKGQTGRGARRQRYPGVRGEVEMLFGVRGRKHFRHLRDVGAEHQAPAAGYFGGVLRVAELEREAARVLVPGRIAADRRFVTRGSDTLEDRVSGQAIGQRHHGSQQLQFTGFHDL